MKKLITALIILIGIFSVRSIAESGALVAASPYQSAGPVTVKLGERDNFQTELTVP